MNRNYIRSLSLGLAVFLFGVTRASAQDSVSAANAYAESLKEVQQCLADGKIDAAVELLGQTNPAMRGLEYRLLSAACDAKKSSVVDLIQPISYPSETKTRYGVMHPSGDWVVFISQDGGLRRINPESSEKTFDVVPHPDSAAVWRAGFDAKGDQFFAAHANGDVMIWNTDDWSTHQRVSLGDKPVLDLAVAASGDAFAATGSKSVQFWQRDGDTFVHRADLIKRMRFGNGIAISPDEQWVAYGGMFDIAFYNIKGGEPPQPVRHASYTMGLAFAPDSQRIASAPRGNINKLLAIFDVSGGERISAAGPFKSYIAGMVFSADGRRLICTGCENVIRIFDVQSGVVVLSLPRPECGAEPFLVADDQVLAWSERSGFCIIDLRAKPAP